MKNYVTWLRTAFIAQLITALIHAITLFGTLPANNDTEKQLLTLMDTYQFDLGSGYHRTMGELLLVLSSCFSLVCLLGGLLNWYLLREKVELRVMKGVVTINLIVFGTGFILTVTFAFLPPIIMMGSIVLSLLLSRFTIPKTVDKF